MIWGGLAEKRNGWGGVWGKTATFVGRWFFDLVFCQWDFCLIYC
jgi:hypothetical protein